MIIDAHTHFYDPSRPEGVPWPNPKDELLYRTVLPDHFKAVAVPEGVTGTVVVEAGEWVEDNAWILGLAEREPFIVGFVGNLEPGAEGFSRNLNRFAKNPLFRGIRLRGKIIESMGSASVVADLEKLADRDLALDLLVRQPHLRGTISLATKLPNLRIVINHVGGVLINGKPPDPAWCDGMREAASHSNVYCKVSGLASATRQIPAPSPAEGGVAFYEPTLNLLWEAFGSNRLLYGSDWPVSARYADYPSVLQVVRKYFEAKGTEAAEKYFWKNSKAVYKWIER